MTVLLNHEETKKDPQRITEINLKYTWKAMMHEEGIMHYANTGIILQ